MEKRTMLLESGNNTANGRVYQQVTLAKIGNLLLLRHEELAGRDDFFRQ